MKIEVCTGEAQLIISGLKKMRAQIKYRYTGSVRDEQYLWYIERLIAELEKGIENDRNDFINRRGQGSR